VTQANTLDSVDKQAGRTFLKHEIEVLRNELLAGSSNIDREFPLVVHSDWMVGRDSQSLVEADHFNELVDLGNQHAHNFGGTTIQGSDLITFLDITNKFGGAICHSHRAISSDASSAVIIVGSHVSWSNVVLLFDSRLWWR